MEQGDLNLEVYRANGARVLQKMDVYELRQSYEQLDLKKFGSGVYIVRFSDGNHSVSKKIIVQ